MHQTNTLNTLAELLAVIADLARARDLSQITAIVRRAARRLSGADGATFVLRDGDQCFYVDEDAIGPLWKGSRFPMSCCVSGWVMEHGEAVVIGDIYQDPGIPIDAYSPTFVKSLAMVPIRRDAAIGAIGTYWATNYTAPPETVRVLQALADSAAVAFENLDLYAMLRHKVLKLEAANRELSDFAWAAAHDLREPCRTVCTLAQVLHEDFGNAVNEAGRKHLESMKEISHRLYDLVGGIMALANMQPPGLRVSLNLNDVVRNVCSELHTLIEEADADISVERLPTVETDPRLVSLVIQQLLVNSITFRSNKRKARVEISAEPRGPHWIIRVKDNGIGIPEQFKESIFKPFKRLHSRSEYSGNGIGLSIARKATEMLGGEIWIDSTRSDESTCVCFSLPIRRIQTGTTDALTCEPNQI